MIYKLVLGGNTIHIHTKRDNNGKRSLTRRICTAPDSDETIASAIDNATIDENNIEQWWKRHTTCNAKGQTGHQLSLALLHVCREIFHDARHLHLTCITFSFDCMSAMYSFAQHLIRYGTIGDIRTINLSPTCLPWDLRLFHGLREVTLFWSVFFNSPEWAAQTEEQLKSWWAKYVASDLQAIHICAHFVPLGDRVIARASVSRISACTPTAT